MWAVTIHGARGTIPAFGSTFHKYGGNTTCYSLRTEKGVILFDAGTGVSRVASEIATSGEQLPITLFFTHFHLDHVMGFPCFDPLYDARASIKIMADPRRTDNWRNTLHAFMAKPYWPVGLGDTDIKMTLEDIPVQKDAIDVYGVKISWFSVPHPQQCLSYRVDTSKGSTVIATDTEYAPDSISKAFIDFCRDADFLVFDSQYTPEEYPKHTGWGHSSWRTATRIAEAAGVRQLILTHHAPTRTDMELEGILIQARSEFKQTEIAMEGTTLARNGALSH